MTDYPRCSRCGHHLTRIVYFPFSPKLDGSPICPYCVNGRDSYRQGIYARFSIDPFKFLNLKKGGIV